ncbi:MAG: hypothetical protein QOJ64_2198, partial [Acidobacteriota bacterium]|nr:hypothetical protein [Acidobacteriota bacterium]
MKQCSTCREEFADKFSFCPVDGTPLADQLAEASDFIIPDREQVFSSLPVHSDAAIKQPPPAATVAAVRAPRTDEYHLTFVDDTGLTRRLMGELKEVAHNSELTWPEFKRDPFGYSGRFIKGYSSLLWRFFSTRNVAIATSTALLVVLSVVITFIVTGRNRAAEIAQMNKDLVLEQFLTPDEIPPEAEKAK